MMYYPLRNVCANMRAGGPRQHVHLRYRVAPAHRARAPTRWAPCMPSRRRPASPPGGPRATRGHHVAGRDRRRARFGGDVNGRFRAFEDTSGEILWEINLGSPVSGFPITYAVDGRQYVAVSTGTARFINLTRSRARATGTSCSCCAALTRIRRSSRLPPKKSCVRGLWRW